VAPRLTQHRAGSGPPLVLVHGLGLSWRSWLPIVDALESEHDVIGLDLPGFGQSPVLSDGVAPTPAALAGAIVDELDALGLDDPAIVGNSLGGWIALEVARRGRASRVVAISPSGLELPPERAYVISLDEMLRAQAMACSPFGRLATQPLPARIWLFGLMRSRPWRVKPDEGAHELRAFGHAPAFQSTLFWTEATNAPVDLDQIRVPVRIAFGTLDLLLGAYTAPRFAAAIPDAELVPLPGVGHVPMSDDPAMVARTITDFTTDAGAPG
jgi:pimeloyl-ACP methyl ester carboxylesterase